MAELKIKIGADVAQGVQGIRVMNGELNTLGKTATTAGNSAAAIAPKLNTAGNAARKSGTDFTNIGLAFWFYSDSK
jgi:hypothetical protein